MTVHTLQHDIFSELKPNLTEAGLPDYSVQDLRNMAKAGFARLGTVAALVVPNGDFLMFHHKGADKGNPKIQQGGAFGFIAETTHYSTIGDTISVESSKATFLRGFIEEANMHPRLLHLHFSPAGSYATSRWPVGFNAKQREQFAFAVVPIMHISSHIALNVMLERFEETKEIDGLEVMSRNELRNHSHYLRNGTLDILNVVESSGLYETKVLESEIQFPNTTSYTGTDVVFEKMSL